MRKLAVISDIHGNLEALDSVLAQLKGLEIICLGDFVDYGAEPNEVIERIRGTGARSIIGNHDAAALSGDTSMFNAKAAMSSMWTRTKLTDESRAFLEGLPEEMRVDLDGVGFYFTHGSPDDRLWEYIDPRTDEGIMGHFLDKLGVQAMGLGHTHLPYVWRDGNRVVFNPGSVGQPRDGDWRASYALVSVDRAEVGVQIGRAEYDVEGAASKIRAAGLPGSHAERLGTGS